MRAAAVQAFRTVTRRPCFRQRCLISSNAHNPHNRLQASSFKSKRFLSLSSATLGVSALALHTRNSPSSDSSGSSPSLLEGRKPRPPPRFTTNLPKYRVDSNSGKKSFSTSTSTSKPDTQLVLSTSVSKDVNNNNKDKEDCPLCRHYSKGTCGSLFTKWMECTDANPGVDEKTGEELHLTECADLAQTLADCLASHAEEYAGPIDYDDGGIAAVETDDSGESSSVATQTGDLADAWCGLIASIESSERATAPFPTSIRPELEVRPSSGWGVASFAPVDQRDEPLIMSYLKDQNGTVLAAGSGDDLVDTGGFLRFVLDDDTENVTACALYGGEDDDPLYERTARLPPR